MKSVYLSGPIGHQTLKEVRGWRDEVVKHLHPGIHALNPLRGHLGILPKEGVLSPWDGTNNALATPSAITMRDRDDTMKCDAMLVNLLGATKVSIGTMIELGWADAARVPIVLVIDPGNIHWHPMVQNMSGIIVTTLEEGIDAINIMLGR